MFAIGFSITDFDFGVFVETSFFKFCVPLLEPIFDSNSCMHHIDNRVSLSYSSCVLSIQWPEWNSFAVLPIGWCLWHQSCIGKHRPPSWRPTATPHRETFRTSEIRMLFRVIKHAILFVRMSDRRKSFARVVIVKGICTLPHGRCLVVGDRSRRIENRMTKNSRMTVAILMSRYTLWSNYVDIA